MTTSAIRFNKQSIFVKDPELREFIKALAYHLPDFARDNAVTADWLVEVCAVWMDEHENMPPGLRDIELDEVLTTQERLAGLADYLNWLKKVTPASHTYDAQTAHQVIDKVQREWNSLRASSGDHGQQTAMQWKYFGNTRGMGKVIDIYRLPFAKYGGTLDFEHFGLMERLLADGSWVAGQGQRAEKSWIDGWFDESDQIDEATVQALVHKWQKEGWPGK